VIMSWVQTDHCSEMPSRAEESSDFLRSRKNFHFPYYGWTTVCGVR